MLEYILIMLIILEYACICPNKQSSTLFHWTDFCAVIETVTYSEHCQTFKMEHIEKKESLSAGMEPEKAAKQFGGFFFLDTLKTTFWKKI